MIPLSLTITCMLCTSRNHIQVDPIGFRAWQNGVLIQRALPDSSEEDRELLISKLCSECFNSLQMDEE